MKGDRIVLEDESLQAKPRNTSLKDNARPAARHCLCCDPFGDVGRLFSGLTASKDRGEAGRHRAGALRLRLGEEDHDESEEVGRRSEERWRDRDAAGLQAQHRATRSATVTAIAAIKRASFIGFLPAVIVSCSR
jgi:hypothetical protein